MLFNIPQYGIALKMADKLMFYMNVDKVVDCVKTILDNPSENRPKKVSVTGDKLTGKEIESIVNFHLASNTFFVC